MPPKKKSKAKPVEVVPDLDLEDEEPTVVVHQGAMVEDDDSGETRCVCGMQDDDYGFMVQCDLCKVWQHGFCVGFTREEAGPEDYFCEQCRPDLHVENLRNRKKSVKGQPPSGIAPTSSSHHDPATKITTSNLLASTTGSTSLSRSSRSPTPPMHANAAQHRRRNTLNSREAAINEAIANNNLEKLIADGQDERTTGSRGGQRKRKRSSGLADESGSKRKRSSETPASSTSEPANLLDVDNNAQEGASNNGSIKAEPSSRRGKRTRKNREASAETDALPPPPPPVPKAKQPNQYTNRAKGNPSASVNGSPTKSGATNGRNANSASVAPDPGQSAGPRRNQAANTRPIANSPPPAPLSWNLPDHLSHLSDLLPTPHPQNIEIRTGPSLEKTADKPSKVKWPLKRTTIGEMRRRVRAMLDFVTKAHVDALEREKRVKALDEAKRLADDLKGKGKVKEPLPTEDGTPGPTDVEMRPPSPSLPSIGETSFADISTGIIAHAASLAPEGGGTTAQLLASLTQDLINFQEKFGAGPGGKLYRERVERERRPRGAAAAAVSGLEREDL